MITKDLVKTCSAGAVFGTALSIAGVADPQVIIDQMRLVNFRMLEAFLVAGSVSAVVIQAFHYFDIRHRVVRPNSTLGLFSRYDANIIGGALIGVGMSLSGACPGTVLVQLAQGFAPSRFTALGALIGGCVHAAISPVLKQRKREDSEPQTLGQQMNISDGVAFVALESILISVAALSSIYLPRNSYAVSSPIVGGLLIGGSQAFSLLVSNRALGISAVYEDIGTHLWKALRQNSISAPSPSMMFALGVVLSSMFFPQKFLVESLASSPSALVGGFFLGIGARLAGGCTSGHGLSGLAALSSSSAVTVAAMFGAGILSRSLIDLSM